jgi:endogenous inhibitor of DNA gyrase (YacG/DUF329 family)
MYIRDTGNAGNPRETGIVRKSGYLLTGSDGAGSSAVFLMPGKPYPIRAPAFLRTGEFMKDSGEMPDLSSFIQSCAKRFCPECGKPIEINKIGRPRYFCSNRCRWAHNKREERRREKEREDSNIKNNPGAGTEAGSVQPEKETETGR